MYEPNKKDFSSITAEQAIELLKKHGTIVTVQEAEQILIFTDHLVNIAVEQALRNEAGH